jgi:SOS-response transcriptional repressor LexA
MGENFIERLQYFMEKQGINDNQMTIAAGLSVGLLGKLKKSGKGMSSVNIEKILSSYPKLNADWLLTGKGDMLKGSGVVAEPSKDGTGIPLIPVEAMAGYFAGEQTVLLQECDRYVVPAFRNADFLIHVLGDSMIPHYYSGDMVACKMLSLTDIFFQWGKVYVINTDQGALIKKVEQGTTDESITLVSENEKYKPFEISRRGIYQIAIVIGVIRAE